MTGPLTILQNRLGRGDADDSKPDTTDDSPETVLTECTTCGSVFIQHSGDRCSECGEDSLERR